MAEARKRRYWAMRVDDKNNADLLLRELRQGRLRQGWGYRPDQDLRLVQSQLEKNGKGTLSEHQDEVRPHIKMLATADDGVQVGDWVLVPNLPHFGYFSITEVTGAYNYSPVKLSKGQDYGHILPIRILTEKGVSKFASEVDASIRKTLKNRRRMWSMDQFGTLLGELVAKASAGADLTAPKSGEARLEKAWETALDRSRKELQKQLGETLDSGFQAAEWEEPIKAALEGLYPGAEIDWVAGRNEAGADVLVQIPDVFRESSPWLIVVQVKNYDGEIGAGVLKQLKTAYERYRRDGRVLALVVMTTALKASDELRRSAEQLEKELRTEIEIVLREKLLQILSEGLMSQ